MRLPSSARNVIAFEFIGPWVSTATGMKTYVLASSWYFVSFLSAGLSAAPPAFLAAVERYDEASVSAVAICYCLSIIIVIIVIIIVIIIIIIVIPDSALNLNKSQL